MIVLITDPKKSDDELVTIAEQACQEIPRGKLAILLRDRQRDVRGVLDVGTRISEIAHAHGQLFFLLREHLGLAYEISTAGMHVAGDYREALRVNEWTGGRSLVSASAHTDADVERALAFPIDWLFVSPIFATPEKGAPRSIEAIRNARKITGDRATPRIVALGGIHAENAASCMHAGAHGVAVIRSILHAEDPRAATRDLWKAIESVPTIET